MYSDPCPTHCGTPVAYLEPLLPNITPILRAIFSHRARTHMPARIRAPEPRPQHRAHAIIFNV